MPTHRNYRYFLTILDDFSRSTWTFLLQQKSQSFCIIEKFHNFVKTHFQTQIKTLRSDNALEVDTLPCQTFFDNNGIVHQTTCVHMSEQNGRVERKHRSIIDMDRAIRFHSGVPIEYWGDSILAATYILNRLPTPLLQHKTPFEKLLSSPLPLIT